MLRSMRFPHRAAETYTFMPVAEPKISAWLFGMLQEKKEKKER